jgi:hypothetical protein
MLNTTGDIITEVLIRNNRSTTDSFITDAMLQDWIQDAHSWAASYHKWPFTEKRDQSTAWSGSEEVLYSSLGVGFRTDSIRLLTIGGKRFQKLNFEDYQIFKEEQPSSTDKVYSDFGRTLFINTASGASGSLVAYGQYSPNLDPTDLASTTIFSTYDEEGNEAIVEKMTCYLKRREHLPNEAELHDQRAVAKLEEVWTRITDEQFAYHPSPRSEGMWKRFDILQGDSEDGLNTNQF